MELGATDLAAEQTVQAAVTVPVVGEGIGMLSEGDRGVTTDRVPEAAAAAAPRVREAAGEASAVAAEAVAGAEAVVDVVDKDRITQGETDRSWQ